MPEPTAADRSAPAVEGGASAEAGDASDATTRPVAAEVDARGLACPMPVIELARAVEAEPVGAIVRLLATDPAAKVDVPVWCRMQRQALRAATEGDDAWVFLVEKVR